MIVRCPRPCGRFHAEFPEGIPALLTVKLSPCPRCKRQLVIVAGQLEWWQGLTGLGESFKYASK